MEKFNFNNELSGKIALVTGGTKGAGKAIAERLLKAGATVIITARNAPEKANEKLHFISADLSESTGTQKVVDEVLSTYKKLDIVVNNLGGSETQGGGFAVLNDKGLGNKFTDQSLSTNTTGQRFFATDDRAKKRCHYSHCVNSGQIAFI